MLSGGNEYRIATYRGAKASSIRGGELVIRQRALTFSAKLLSKNDHPLKAPVTGAMVRTIRENASCTAEYSLENNGGVILHEVSPRASFEYEYPDK